MIHADQMHAYHVARNKIFGGKNYFGEQTLGHVNRFGY